MYEVRAADEGGHNTTCLASCRDSLGCHNCGRPNCKGQLCDDCSTSCWTQDPIPAQNAYYVFYPTLTVIRGTYCYNEWQLAWNHGSVYMFPEHVAGTYRIFVQVYYQDKLRTAIFDGSRYTRTYLTVGNYVSGDAGNGWGAPFVNRVVLNNVNSNLYQFFYGSSSYSAGGVESYQDQMNRNATTIARGYYWAHSDPAVFGMSIRVIKFWVTP